MPFTSYNFIFIFLPIVLLIHSFIPKSWRHFNLLIANILFIFYTGLGGLIIIVGSAVTYYIMAIAIQISSRKRLWLLICILTNVFILCYFKYNINIVWRLNAIFGWTIDQTKVIMPLGISFYTFQGIAYISDVYKGKIKAETNLVKFLAFQLFFPAITSGPILRYADIKDQVSDKKFNIDTFYYGLTRFSIGLFKKMYLANRFAWIADNHYNLPGTDIFTGTAWIASIAFMLQIYLDFSGYSDMALGCASMLGIRIKENFNYPYISKSITEFWRRWHMSLSSWFRDYIYIPLGGNRVKLPRYIFNLSVVWLLTGIWHGNSLNFIIWGIFNLVLILFEKYVIDRFLTKKNTVLSHVYTLIMINFAWVFFRANSLDQALLFIRKMLVWDFNMIGMGQFVSMFASFSFDWILAFLVCTPIFKISYQKLTQKNNWLINFTLAIVVLLILSLGVVMVISGSYKSFLYQNF